MSKRDDAKATLLHYLTLTREPGERFTPDADTEIESIVDLILDAVREEAPEVTTANAIVQRANEGRAIQERQARALERIADALENPTAIKDAIFNAISDGLFQSLRNR